MFRILLMILDMCVDFSFKVSFLYCLLNRMTWRLEFKNSSLASLLCPLLNQQDLCIQYDIPIDFSDSKSFLGQSIIWVSLRLSMNSLIDFDDLSAENNNSLHSNLRESCIVTHRHNAEAKILIMSVFSVVPHLFGISKFWTTHIVVSGSSIMLKSHFFLRNLFQMDVNFE